MFWDVAVFVHFHGCSCVGLKRSWLCMWILKLGFVYLLCVRWGSGDVLLFCLVTAVRRVSKNHVSVCRARASNTKSHNSFPTTPPSVHQPIQLETLQLDEWTLSGVFSSRSGRDSRWCTHTDRLPRLFLVIYTHYKYIYMSIYDDINL